MCKSDGSALMMFGMLLLHALQPFTQIPGIRGHAGDAGDVAAASCLSYILVTGSFWGALGDIIIIITTTTTTIVIIIIL